MEVITIEQTIFLDILRRIVSGERTDTACEKDGRISCSKLYRRMSEEQRKMLKDAQEIRDKMMTSI